MKANKPSEREVAGRSLMKARAYMVSEPQSCGSMRLRLTRPLHLDQHGAPLAHPDRPWSWSTDNGWPRLARAAQGVVTAQRPVRQRRARRPLGQAACRRGLHAVERPMAGYSKIYNIDQLAFLTTETEQPFTAAGFGGRFQEPRHMHSLSLNRACTFVDVPIAGLRSNDWMVPFHKW